MSDHELYFYEDDDGDRPPHSYVVIQCRCEGAMSTSQRWRYPLGGYDETLPEVLAACGEHAEGFVWPAALPVEEDRT